MHCSNAGVHLLKIFILVPYGRDTFFAGNFGK